MEFNDIKKQAKQMFVTGVKSTFSTTHIVLKYTIDLVQEAEVYSMKHLTGEDRDTVIQGRRKHTLAKQKEHKELAKTIKEEMIRMYKEMSSDEEHITNLLTN